MRTRFISGSPAPAGIAMLAVAALGAQRAGAGASVGEPAPDFVLKSASGSNLRLSEYRGEVVAVAFWASWCGGCRARLEQLGELTDRYGDTGLRTLSVSLDADRASAREAAERMGLGFPVLFDDAGEVGETYEADALPTVVLVDRSGVLRDELAGRQGETGLAIVERVRELLRVSRRPRGEAATLRMGGDSEVADDRGDARDARGRDARAGRRGGADVRRGR